MDERRYTEEEVSAIFERAAEAQQAVRRALPPGEGLTLTDLREIGREVGIPAELVDLAARGVDQRGRDATRTFIGLPVGVGRTVDLGRRLTDDEWERLVVDLRETFDARGTLRTDGSLRQWTNGNLQALLEPTPTGHRLRLRTVRGGATGSMTAGLGFLGVGVVMAIASAVTGHVAGTVGGMTGTLIGAWGAAMFALGAVRLPAWARTRRRQMEGVAARLALATATPPAEELPPADRQPTE